MTVTLNRIDANPIEERTRTAPELRDILRGALDAVALLDPEQLHSYTFSGQAAIALSEAIRAATAALGAEPGAPLRAAPGVVVVRDLTVAASRLELAAMRCGAAAEPTLVGRLAVDLSLACHRLLLSLPATL